MEISCFLRDVINFYNRDDKKRVFYSHRWKLLSLMTNAIFNYRQKSMRGLRFQRNFSFMIFSIKLSVTFIVFIFKSKFINLVSEIPAWTPQINFPLQRISICKFLRSDGRMSCRQIQIKLILSEKIDEDTSHVCQIFLFSSTSPFKSVNWMAIKWKFIQIPVIKFQLFGTRHASANSQRSQDISSFKFECGRNKL